MSETVDAALPVSVLIVDDEELLVKSCTQILSSEGYTVFSEGRGRNAMDVVRRHRPDVVLTDLMLPDMKASPLLFRSIPPSPLTASVIKNDCPLTLDSYNAVGWN